MNAGMIVIAILGGALLVLLIVGMAVLGWVLWQVKAAVAAHTIQLASHATETKATIEAAKASFASIRADMSRLQADFTKNTQDVLQAHAVAIGSVLGKINAEALEAASIRGLKACVGMEQASVKMANIANVMQKMLIEMDDEPGRDLGAEDYGPDDTGATIYARQSDVARADAEAEVEGILENSLT